MWGVPLGPPLDDVYTTTMNEVKVFAAAANAIVYNVM